jgi:hypothetical protein
MKNNKNTLIGITLIFLEISLLFTLISLAPQEVLAGIGSPTTDPTTNLTIANSFPEVHNISINYDNPITLTPNDTTLIECLAIIIDWNGDSDIKFGNATIFDSTISESNPDDDNDHYTNQSCLIDTNTNNFQGIADDAYNALINCTFEINYFANPGPWNCTIEVNDSAGNIGTGTKEETVSQLLALGLPDVINYGTVNATAVSEERTINVTNFGNIKVNLSLEGYGAYPLDGNAMNCTLGGIKNISVENEKYNLTTSISGAMNLTQFQSNYTSLNPAPTTKQFNLTSRLDDLADDTTKPTYWRIYVPTGVAGTCQGNIVFGATTASEI